MSELQILDGNSPEIIAQAQEIRRIVFIEGQGVPEARDRDGLDSDALHFLGSFEGVPVATARVRRLELGGTYNRADVKIERVGVLDEFQGLRLGKKLMEHILRNLAGDVLIRDALLESQVHAMGFYSRLGFVSNGIVFEDAGIPHTKMKKHIHSRTASEWAEDEL